MNSSDSPDPLAYQEGGDHYKDFVIQPVVFIEQNDIPFLEGAVIQRMVRHGVKDGVADLKKAIHEIKLLALLLYNEVID